ncbi:unnamed protein product [Ilex paraguariensis]|uniref:Bidirectional sugar transporter SWEET n=1 Tax=Ilex paraguariensis TaxID=185542 RepID=A0ABC8R128_9AQUA
MGDKLRLAVGVMGNLIFSFIYLKCCLHVTLCCTLVILTFSMVIKKKSTEEFSCVPYIIALLNCFLYTWYGLPVVSYRWENFPLVTTNGVGILLELSFILPYFWFASVGGKASILYEHIYRWMEIHRYMYINIVSWVQKKVAMITIPVILAFAFAAAISACVFHDHHHRKVFVGSIGLVASVAMYGSPLVVVCPNLVGSPLGILQLVLYFKYRKTGTMEEQQNWDMEKDNEKHKQQLQFVVTDTYGKI